MYPRRSSWVLSQDSVRTLPYKSSDQEILRPEQSVMAADIANTLNTTREKTLIAVGYTRA
jgi:hypothetical protein